MDQRDDQTWVVIELSHLGETKVDEGTLEAILRRDLDVQAEFPIFIPVISYPKGNRTINIHLMEGYVFVGSGLQDTIYFALERKEYVEQIISTPGRVRSLSVVPNSKIEDLRKQLRKLVASDLQTGATVRVTNGTYRNLEGLTIVVSGDTAIVRIKLRSLDLMATIPTVFLEAISNPNGETFTDAGLEPDDSDMEAGGGTAGPNDQYEKELEALVRIILANDEYERELDALADLIMELA